MRLGLVLVAAMSLSDAAVAAPVDGRRQLEGELAHLCPARHLDELKPAELNGAIESFRDGLSPRRRARLERANDEDRACADVIAGASCENLAYLRALIRTGMLPAFTKSLCGMSDLDLGR